VSDGIAIRANQPQTVKINDTAVIDAPTPWELQPSFDDTLKVSPKATILRGGRHAVSAPVPTTRPAATSATKSPRAVMSDQY
jgi:hypothetical protein